LSRSRFYAISSPASLHAIAAKILPNFDAIYGIASRFIISLYRFV